MSTTPIAQPLASLNATPAPARSNAAAAQPAVQFGQTLSREIAQRQATPQPAAPASAKAAAPRQLEKAPAPRPEQGAKPAEQAAAQAPDAAAPRQAAPANNGSAGSQPGDKGSSPTDDSAAAAAAAADSAAAAAARAELPVADMLALVASLTQPAQAAAAPVAADPAWSTLGASRAATSAIATDPNAAADAALAAFTAPAMAAAGRLPAVDGAPTAPAIGALALPAEASLATESAAPQGDLRALLEGAMPRAAGSASDSAQGQAAPAPTTALQTAAVPVDAAKLAPAARELPDAITAIDTKAAEPAPVAAPLQQAAVGLAQAANAGADKLSARVGTPAWDNQVGQKIVWMVAGKEQSATLTLNPPDLGPVQVVLNISGDNASVMFSSGELEVRQALENAMPKLREMMDESGISLGNASVNAGMPEQRQDQGERAGAAGNGGAGSSGGLRGVVNGSAADANERLAARTPAQGGLGLVDTFA